MKNLNLKAALLSGKSEAVSLIVIGVVLAIAKTIIGNPAIFSPAAVIVAKILVEAVTGLVAQ